MLCYTLSSSVSSLGLPGVPRKRRFGCLVPKGLQVKTCSHCKIDKEEAEFNRCSSRPDGLYPICKSCRSVMRPGQKNGDHVAASRRYYQSHKEECAARSNHWKEAHRERYLEIKRTSEKLRNSIKRALGGDKISQSEIDALYIKQEGLCKYCHAGLNNHYHMDHRVPIKLGGKHELSNIQLLCTHCNSSKKATPPEEYERKIGYVAS